MKTHHQILIVGGGNAGISVAARLLNERSKLDIAIIDPADKHYYQPAFTLVGGGVYDIEKTVREESEVIPEGAKWIREAASEFFPEENTLKTKEGNSYTYDYLVVCPGIQLNWDAIKGLKETLNKNEVCSNYLFDTAPYTRAVVEKFKGGTALFTNPGTPVKCGGAPQKVMYLAADNFKKRGVLQDSDIRFCTAGGTLFGVEKYRKALLKVVDRYGIEILLKHDLTEVDGENKTAKFKVTSPEGVESEKLIPFDMMHVTPPQSAPDFIKNSPLANQDGWVDVDKYRLQHTKYPNIFSLGDASGAPNAKTGAAIRKQAPVLVKNLLAQMDSTPLDAKYNGYGSCPLVTGYGKLILAEFNYDGEPTETFPFNQAKERWSMWLLKTKVLPWLYWNRILKGKA